MTRDLIPKTGSPVILENGQASAFQNNLETNFTAFWSLEST